MVEEGQRRTLDLRRAEAAYALVVYLLDFGFLGGGEGERVAEVVFFGRLR